jgi:hypothetical protein
MKSSATAIYCFVVTMTISSLSSRVSPILCLSRKLLTPCVREQPAFHNSHLRPTSLSHDTSCGCREKMISGTLIVRPRAFWKEHGNLPAFLLALIETQGRKSHWQFCFFARGRVVFCVFVFVWCNATQDNAGQSRLTGTLPRLILPE